MRPVAHPPIRELVKEREIYRRKRAIGLSMTTYLCSTLAMGAAINLNPLKPPDERDLLWDHEAGRWIGELFVLSLLMAAIVVVIWLLLRRFDPKRRSGITAGAPLVYQGPPRGSPRAH